MKMVVTYQSSNNAKISLCAKCAKDLAENWPRDDRGEELSIVSFGRHYGHACDPCDEKRRKQLSA